MKCLGHPEEFYNLLRFRMGGQRKFIPKMDQVGRASLYPRGSVAAPRTGDNGERPRAPVSLRGGVLAWVPHPSWTLSSSLQVPTYPLPVFLHTFFPLNLKVYFYSNGCVPRLRLERTDLRKFNSTPTTPSSFQTHHLPHMLSHLPVAPISFPGASYVFLCP